ncbi:MAG TPA: hypothetical protein P5137_01225 [Candidatus Brocadiia bacterium]|nr:hypothetical protein [Candidatus Brocadiia bacterium]
MRIASFLALALASALAACGPSQPPAPAGSQPKPAAPQAAQAAEAAASAVKAAAAAGDKYADFRVFMQDMMKSADEFTAAVDKAADGKAAAAALNKMGEKLAANKAKFEELEKKYPELKKSEPPAELKDLKAAADQMGPKVGAAMAKLNTKFANDPDVKKALEDFQKIMK